FRRQELVLQPGRPDGRFDVGRNSQGWNLQHAVADNQHVDVADFYRVARRNQLVVRRYKAVLFRCLCSFLLSRERGHCRVPFLGCCSWASRKCVALYAAAALIGTDQAESSITCAGAAPNSWA